MSDPVFKFTDATNMVVSRTWPDGRCESYLVAAQEFKAWVAAGNVPSPADPAVPAQPQPTTEGIQVQLDALTTALKAKNVVTSADLAAAATPIKPV